MAKLAREGEIPDNLLTSFEREMQETTDGKVTKTWKEYAKGYVPDNTSEADSTFDKLSNKTAWSKDKKDIDASILSGKYTHITRGVGQEKAKAHRFSNLKRQCAGGDKNACLLLQTNNPSFSVEKTKAKEQVSKLPMSQRMGFAEGGLLDDSSRLWKMESQYPEFEKGITKKGVVPTTPIEEQYNYSPTQQGYALGGIVALTVAAGAAGYGLGSWLYNQFSDKKEQQTDTQSTTDMLRLRREQQESGLEALRKEQRGYEEGGEIMNYDDTGSMLAPEVPLNFEEDMPMDYPMGEESETGLSPEEAEVLGQAMSDYPELEGILNKVGSAVDSDFTGDGAVDGPGTETSDSINAKLSDGEFVFTAKAVKQLGVDKLRKMMDKAEGEYDESSMKQEYQQMDDTGFAKGGFFDRPGYKEGNYVQRPKVLNNKEGMLGSLLKSMGKAYDGAMDYLESDVQRTIDPDEEERKQNAEYQRQQEIKRQRGF